LVYSKIDAKKGLNGEKKEPEEWGEFLHQPGVKYTDFNLIREEVVRDTELKTGKNAGKHSVFFRPSSLCACVIELFANHMFPFT
jgi:hypothetical protein